MKRVCNRARVWNRLHSISREEIATQVGLMIQFGSSTFVLVLDYGLGFKAVQEKYVIGPRALSMSHGIRHSKTATKKKKLTVCTMDFHAVETFISSISQ